MSHKKSSTMAQQKGNKRRRNTFQQVAVHLAECLLGKSEMLHKQIVRSVRRMSNRRSGLWLTCRANRPEFRDFFCGTLRLEFRGILFLRPPSRRSLDEGIGEGKAGRWGALAAGRGEVASASG
jgi:hypothetical protein